MKLKKFFLAVALVAVCVVEARSENSDGLLLVANKGDCTLAIINPATGERLAAVPEDGVTGHEVVAAADGLEAFVPIYGNSGVGKPGTDGSLIRAIDLKTRSVIGTLDFGHGVRPHCAVIGPKNHLLYVTTELENSISVIDPKTFKRIGTIPTGQPESHMLAISSDGKTGYTANVGPGTVSVLDLEKNVVRKIIPISKTTQRIAISPDDKWGFTADQTQPQLAVIDTAKNAVAQWIELPGVGYGTAVTPDGRWLVVAMSGISQVGIVDLQTRKIAHLLAVPKTPQEVLIRPDGAVAYVSCSASGLVTVIDLKKFTVEKPIPAGKGADGLAWAMTK